MDQDSPTPTLTDEVRRARIRAAVDQLSGATRATRRASERDTKAARRRATRAAARDGQ